MAILAKGPVGFLLPIAWLGLFLMIVNSRPGRPNKCRTRIGSLEGKMSSILYTFRPMNFLKSLWQLRPITGVIVMLCVALPWYVMVGERTGGLWLEQFFAKFNFRPFMQPILGHSGPFWLHVPYLLVGFFPWSVFHWSHDNRDGAANPRRRPSPRRMHTFDLLVFRVFCVLVDMQHETPALRFARLSGLGLVDRPLFGDLDRRACPRRPQLDEKRLDKPYSRRALP